MVKDGIIQIILSIRFFFFFFIAVFFWMSCSEKMQPEAIDDPEVIVWKLNRNVEGLRNLASAIYSTDSIAIFSINHNEDGSVRYQMNMREGEDIEMYSAILAHQLVVPTLSMKQVGNDFFWMINSSFLMNNENQMIDVENEDISLQFFWEDGDISLRLGSDVLRLASDTRASYLAQDVSITYEPDVCGFCISLSSGQEMILPTIEDFHFLREDVLNNSYYKDIFLDAGIGLSSRKTLAAAKYLGLSLEGISLSSSDYSSEDCILQNEILGGNDIDLNGRLLYPDGQPRYKLLFVNGGNSRTHGISMETHSLEAMRLFYLNGGSYVGTCAGAFFASNGYDGKKDYPHYLSIWPGMIQHTGLRNTYTGMILEKNSPLLDYYDFGGDYYVDSIRHNGGGYPLDYPVGTEILARYDYPLDKSVHMQPSIWTFKNGLQSGRIIQEGSHPESITFGERRDLTAAMLLYAIEGRGITRTKGFLKKGEPRIMEKRTTDRDPDYTRIGDLQTHHFAVYIPSNARNVSLELDSPLDCDLQLRMNRDSYAYPEVAEFSSVESGARKRLCFPFIEEGIWYVSVTCMTTVSVEETQYGQNYVGRTDVLNGVPYTIKIDWD